MKGKADMLVANRILSALVVVCLVVSAFAGLLVLMVSTPMNVQAASLGDLTVSSGTYTIQNIEQPVDGNVTVTGTGNLTIRDATLSVISNFDPTQRHTITVSGNGAVLYLDHGTITSYLDQINPWPFISLVVQNGGHLIASGQSVLMFPGNITLSNNAQVVLHDTQIVKLPDSEVTKYVVGTSGHVSFDAADDGPGMSITDSTLEIYDSSIANLPEYLTQLASNITLAGSSVMLAVNSYVGIDFGPINIASDWYRHNSLSLSGTSHAYLYGTSFEPYIGSLADRVPAIVSSGAGSSLVVPQSKGPADNTGQALASLAAVDSNTYQISPGQTMEIETFNTGGLSDALLVRSARLIVTYSVAGTYTGTNPIQWAREGTPYSSTSIVPHASDPPGTTGSFSIPIASVPTVGDIRNLDVLFANNGGVGAVQIDQLAITVGLGADAYVYRWLNVTVGDAYGVPIPKANVTAKFTGATSLEGQNSIYYTSTGISTSPPAQVLSYMGQSSTSFRMTKDDGRAVIPYLTDIISNEGSTISSFVGSFAITGTANISSVLYSSTESFSFPAYPAMDLGDRSFDVTVEITGVSAPSPDQSRWLVVPVSPTQPSLTIEGMTYYHAGDVIVAAGGTLTFDDAMFELVQVYPNERTVYVDGTMAQPGKLVFEKSGMNSDMGINIVVKGYAVLEVLNSTFTGVNIVALDHSTVLLRNATIDQQITTAWDSHSTIDVKDSTLVQPIVLSGYSIGGFTNTSVPSIKVTDSAEAMIYRWIHVTVFDGAGKPLPNATVSAYYLVSGVFAKSAVTSSDPLSRGVAQINANGTKITALGSTFVGNYKVSAFYAWGSPVQYYWADQNISVGVMPYSEPLGKNATYATMKISSALPHLFVNQGMGPIVATPSSPVKGQMVTVNATVNNSGPVGAYNVKVDFFDNGVLFDTVIVPEIKPGDHAVASGHWTAALPLAPFHHNISISADPRVAGLTPVVGWIDLTVQSLPDIAVLPGITVTSLYPEVQTTTTVSATIANNGDQIATPVTIRFLDDGIPFATLTGNSIDPFGQILREPQWTPATTGVHNITVAASTPQHELSITNNVSSILVVVLPHPDLRLSNIAFVPTGSISGGTTVIVRAKLANTGEVPISLPKLRLDVTGTGVSMPPQNSTLFDVIDLRSGSGEVTVETSFTAPVLTHQTDVTVTLTINPDGTIIESDAADDTNNAVSGVITVLDVRPDLSILPGEILIKRGTANLTAEQFGRTITISANVQNLGGQSVMNPGFRANIGIRNTDAAHSVNYTLFNVTNVNIGFNSTNHTAKIMKDWTISLTSPGQYEIWVFLDPLGTIDEPYKNNNFAFKNFTLNTLSMNVVLTSAAGYEFKAGEMVTVSAIFTYSGTTDPVKLLPGVQFLLVDSTTDRNIVIGSNSTVLKTDSNGGIVTSLLVPVDLKSGNYYIRAIVPDSGGPYDSDTAIHVSSIKNPGLLPLWAWIAIIVGAVAVVLGFMAYTYKYGLGKLVECGECGAFIPAASKRCPKCGVEFEVGTMKCSECGAWIPAESTECPNCGVKFVGETEGDVDYLERMKKEYDEMTSKYRELAKGELGKKFSDSQFEDWFRRQPGYISFDDWLAKEEEKKLEGPIPCKVCGTLNPKEATVCHKCGTVFAKEEPPRRGQPPQGGEPTKEEAAEPAAQPQQPQPVAPRMVIRRPIDRKVVPKKIIKSPLSGESEEQQQ
jgi:subtilase family serine protease/ribosomal protein L40E